MHPLLQYIHDEINSWKYDSPAALTQSVARLLRSVLDSGGRRDDVTDFVALYQSLTEFSTANLEDIYDTLRQWDDGTDSAQLNEQEPNDRMLKFKIGCSWVLSRSLMLFFHPDEKLDSFPEWQTFAVNNPG